MSEHAADNARDTPAEHDNPMAAKLGMWMFLFTEVLLFGTVFIGYAVYQHQYHRDFQSTSHELNKLIGAANTVVLLTSSMTMALAIAALERGRKKRAIGLMTLTVLCALAFMIVKAFEWGHKFEHGIYPTSEVMRARAVGEQVFYGLYFTMTGLHAFHVVIGAAVILVAMRLVARERVRRDRIAFLENAGLYWHLVDVIWIFLFPLFYLIG
ncbi:MAG: cytochrome c oxidase subunit 3 family protein [Phycisphaerae bacterium]|nr:cytochrome c oxidase subunit 3 family protein [Phycisphaerae bacterium]